ncbi:MAG: serine hydrolase domain-containing protein [Armatimonadota bacterium]
MKIMCSILASTLAVCFIASTGMTDMSDTNGDYQSGTVAKVLQPFLDNHTLAGAVVLVASGDEVLATETIGYSDIKSRKLMKPDATFWIASMTKAMTVAALMMLVDEGKLNISDPVEKYLPEFKGQMVVVERDDAHMLLKKPSHPITILEMLSHTSGLLTNYPLAARLNELPLQERVAAFALSPLRFEPGSKFEYGNGGFETAGRIIEVVSGMSYEEFMQKRLLTPLGMTDTTFNPTKQQIQRLAKCYQPNEDKSGMTEIPTPLLDPTDKRSRTANPAGGLFSTAKDVLLFCQMMLNGGIHNGKRLISEASIKQMSTTQTGELFGTGVIEGGYGLGLVTTTKDHGTPLSTGAYGHSGAYRTDMWIDPKTRLITILMIQRGNLDDSSIFTIPLRQAAEKAFKN